MSEAEYILNANKSELVCAASAAGGTRSETGETSGICGLTVTVKEGADGICWRSDRLQESGLRTRVATERGTQ